MNKADETVHDGEERIFRTTTVGEQNIKTVTRTLKRAHDLTHPFSRNSSMVRLK